MAVFSEPGKHKHKHGQVFVFGSNLAGIHGAGSAEEAFVWHGATWGSGVGPMGRAYAIPTKQANVRETMPLGEIEPHVSNFIQYASEHPRMTFFVVAVGTGLSGYKHEQIAPMFKDAPDNCILPPEWKEVIANWQR